MTTGHQPADRDMPLAPTEETPLLASSSEVDEIENLKSEKKITLPRGLCIGFLLGVLILIQGAYI